MDGRERELFSSLKEQGFLVSKTNSSHYKIKCPNGIIIFTGSTPSDWRGRIKLIAQLRREGFVWRRVKSKRQEEYVG